MITIEFEIEEIELLLEALENLATSNLVSIVQHRLEEAIWINKVQQLGELTPRQTEALPLLAEGCSNSEIATRMKMTTHGAEILIGRLKEKFNFPDGMERRVALAIWYRDQQEKDISA